MASSLSKLKAAGTLGDVARILGYKPSALAFLLYKVPQSQKYTTFTVPKKNGGVRTIEAPVEKLKSLQSRLAQVFSDCRRDIESLGHARESISHGFRLGHSILTNARPHKRRHYVFNLDLQDFFPSLNFGRVRGFFIKNRDFALSPPVATVVAQIACNGTALPQGAPSSPIISDLLTHILDVRLARLAKKHGCTYSRYADDLTFSTNRKLFPSEVGLVGPDSMWVAGKGLERIVLKAGFAINTKKTRMQYKTSRQIVTGLTVNQKINIQSDYYRSTRGKCTALFKTGKYEDEGVAFCSPQRLEGAVSFIHYVKSNPSIRPFDKPKPRKKEKKNEKDTGYIKLYRRLLFFKFFLDLDMPLIICEGKTDSVYLKSALKKPEAFLPQLATQTGATFRRKVSFFNYNQISSDVMRLGGGTGDLTKFVSTYEATARYFARLPAHPVIVLVDNDKDGLNVVRACKSGNAISADFDTSDPFFHASANLYVVKTPSGNVPPGVSIIEDLFPSHVKDTKLEGKTFNPENNIGPGQYSKHAFAQRVVLPGAPAIDFSSFKPLFARVGAAIADYRPI